MKNVHHYKQPPAGKMFLSFYLKEYKMRHHHNKNNTIVISTNPVTRELLANHGQYLQIAPYFPFSFFIFYFSFFLCFFCCSYTFFFFCYLLLIVTSFFY